MLPLQEREQAVYDKLNEMGIPYTRREHPAAFTMRDLAEIDHQMGAVHCKNLFLTNKREYYLLMLGGSKKFRTAEVSRQIGSSRLSFAPAEKLEEYLGLEGGAISPMGLIHDARRIVRLLVDEDLRAQDRLCVHPGVNTASIVIGGADFYGIYLPVLGYTPRFVAVTDYLEDV